MSSPLGSVLICDDDKFVYDKLREYFESEKYICADRVSTLQEVQSQLNAARLEGRPFSYVLLDMDLGVGADTGRQIYVELRRKFQTEMFVLYTRQMLETLRQEIARLYYDDGVRMVILEQNPTALGIKRAFMPVVVSGDPRTLFLVHGRDMVRAMRLRKILEDQFGLMIIDWEKASRLARLSRINNNYFDVLTEGIGNSYTTVILLTDDEKVELKPEFVKDSDPERTQPRPRFQSRPNVYVEAGFAFGKRPGGTIIVRWRTEPGSTALPSDLLSMDHVDFVDDRQSRQKLWNMLRDRRCSVLEFTE